MTKSLSPAQQDAINFFGQYAGQRVLVLTTQYRVAEQAERISVGYFKSSTLRGLAARGLLKVETIWRGAWVSVPAKEV
jgi:hypothetical protein